MTVVNKIKIPNTETDKGQDWENPANPEKAEDNRDVEQLLRQKHEAERRKENLSDSDENQEAEENKQ
ncbi:MAG: hypothetical protein H7Y07_11845 [Pyrinomonadaceae bacterium]|nr:hypothetical protein [Sphingobacteriaceae bacterium]